MGILLIDTSSDAVPEQTIANLVWFKYLLISFTLSEIIGLISHDFVNWDNVFFKWGSVGINIL